MNSLTPALARANGENTIMFTMALRDYGESSLWASPMGKAHTHFIACRGEELPLQAPSLEIPSLIVSMTKQQNTGYQVDLEM
jgi:hypothetical protein